ncbi:unnamed protein product, partial [Didymodactylos carnosus]
KCPHTNLKLVEDEQNCQIDEMENDLASPVFLNPTSNENSKFQQTTCSTPISYTHFHHMPEPEESVLVKDEPDEFIWLD